MMISSLPFPPFSGEGVTLALALVLLSALVPHCFFLQGADSGLDMSLLLVKIRLGNGCIWLHNFFFL